MRISMRIILCGALLLGCSGGDDPKKDSGSGGSGGASSGGSGGSGGGTGGSGGGTGGSGGGTGGSGGSGGGTGGSSGSGGGTGGSGGSGGGTGGSGGAGGSAGRDGGTAVTDGSAGDAGGGDASGTGTEGGAAPAANAPYGCTTCKSIFNGTTLDGWETRGAGAWVARNGVLASTGKDNDIWTRDDYGNVRIFFQVRQESGNHKPGTILFGTRPAAGAAPRRGLGGAQFQPPNGASWNYGAGGTFMRLTNPNFDVKKWHQCEVLVKEAGSFRAACCPVTSDGPVPCKGIEVLRWTGKGKKFPFAIQMHNAGLFDEYRNIFVEIDPTADELVSMK
jgi:hypothetical protein